MSPGLGLGVSAIRSVDPKRGRVLRQKQRTA